MIATPTILTPYRVGPMQARPDGPAKLSVEDRGLANTIDQASEPEWTLAILRNEQWPVANSLTLDNPTIQN